MQLCPICQTPVDDDAVFCSQCGTQFEVNPTAQPEAPVQPVAPVQPEAPVQPVSPVQPETPYGYQPQPQQPQAPYGYQPQPVAPQYNNMYEQKPTKSKKGLIIGVSVVVAIIAAVVAFFVFKPDDTSSDSGDNGYSVDIPYYGDIGPDDTSSDSNNNDTPTVFPSYGYNKGEKKDGWYTNSWANIALPIDSKWTEGDAAEYQTYEVSPNVECGILLNDLSSNCQLDIVFEELYGTNASITADEYLDIISSGLDAQYNAYGLSCNISDYYTTFIAGEKYRSISIEFVDSALVQQIHVRNLDGHIVMICATCPNSNKARQIVSAIQPAY